MSNVNLSTTAESATDAYDSRELQKRRKVVGGIRPCISTSKTVCPDVTELETETPAEHTDQQMQENEPRQFRGDARFPQRKPRKECSVPVMQPTSTGKFVNGLWKQLYSEIQWDNTALVPNTDSPNYLAMVFLTSVSGCRSEYAYPRRYESGGKSKALVARLKVSLILRKHQAFRTVNVVCLKYRCQTQTSRALEMVLQTYWIDCYEARIVSIRIEHPDLSSTEARMMALKEACAVLRLTEKELRNRL